MLKNKEGYKKMSIVEKIKNIPSLYHLKGCTDSQIEEAQKELNLKFPAEYIEYVKAYGAISFCGSEWTGLNVDGYLNVVETTKEEKDMNKDFPNDCFVLENWGFERLLTIVNEKGNVFTIQPGNSPVFICDSLSEYVDICIKRNDY